MLAIALAFAALAPMAAGQPGQPDQADESAPDASAEAAGTADTAEVEVTVHDHQSATATIVQTWEDENAQAMRQSLDVFFGTADGQLAEDEVANISEASMADVRGQTMPLFTFDGQTPTVSEVSLEIEGAAGEVTSTEPLTMRHELELDLQGDEGEQHTLEVHPLWDGELTLNAPDGWVITQVSGLEGAEEAQAESQSGSMSADQDVTAEMEPGEPEESVGDDGVPAPGALLTLAAIAVAGVLALALRRDRR